MKTPINDFLTQYSSCDKVRLHMPGHKGKVKGTSQDITEINGADSLFDASGIIDESEENRQRAIAYQIMAVPTIVIDGEVAFVGAPSDFELIEKLESLL